jgi:hypothetical protein
MPHRAPVWIALFFRPWLFRPVHQNLLPHPNYYDTIVIGKRQTDGDAPDEAGPR